MPKVSIIIPVYGVEKYIERCARSLFEQSLDDIEYLFIDDCTPDESIIILNRILEEYPSRKSQVIIHRMNQNSGQAAVRTWGMLNATGDYVIHCDSDDYVDPDMYMSMYNKAISEKSDMVVCDFRRIGKRSERIEKGCHGSDIKEFLENCLFQKDHWGLWNKLFKRTCINDITYPRCDMGEDMMMCVQLIANCQKISYLNMPFYNYCYNQNSISKKRTIENCAHNYYSLRENTEFVINYVISHYNQKDMDVSLVCKYLRMKIRLSLLRIKHLPQYKKQWRESFHFMPFSFFFHPKISSYYKIVYVLSAFNLFPSRKDRAV